MSRTDRFVALLAVVLGCAAAVVTPGALHALAGPAQAGVSNAIALANADNQPQSTAAPPPGASVPSLGNDVDPRLAATAATAEAANEPLRRATALARDGKFKEAIAELEAQRKKGGAPQRSLSLLGTLYLQVGKPVEALAVLHPLADAADAEPATLYQAGRAALMLHEVPVAQGYFQRSLALEAASPAARELGLILAHQGKVVDAYALLRPWAVRNTTDGEALLTAAALAIELERPKEAEQMIAGMPQTDPGIVLVRGKILIEKGEGAQAVTLLTPLMAKHPAGMEPEVRRTLAEADLLAGQPAQSVALLDGHTGKRPSLALLLARAQHQSGSAAAAMATLRPFIDQLPAEGSTVPDPRVVGGIVTEYGQLLVETGHVPDGIGFIERATRLEPDKKEVWQALEQALNTAGRKDEAKKAGAKAAALAQAGIKTGQ